MSVETFRRIAKEMSGLGIQRVIALFFRDYEHSRITPNRIKPADKKRFIAEMDAIASELDLRLSVCKYGRFHRLKCVDVEYFADVHPEKDASVVEHEQSILRPELERRGFGKIRFSDGERDSCGPLSRIVTAVDQRGRTRRWCYG